MYNHFISDFKFKFSYLKLEIGKDKQYFATGDSTYIHRFLKRLKKKLHCIPPIRVKSVFQP